MIAFIRGILVDIIDDKLIIDTGAYGLEVSSPLSTTSKFTNMKEEIFIYTHFKVSEDNMSLYGFSTKEELEAFRLLISVNGVGAKAAISILSSLSVYDLYTAIFAEDIKTISKANGVGAKIAKRISVELKDKVSLESVFENFKEDEMASNKINSKIAKETIEALVSLGYSNTEAIKAVKDLDIADDMSSSKVLSLALRKISR